MTARNWQDHDALRLLQLRQAAGLDRADLARRCLLSIAHIQELEGEGLHGRFYSEAIKFSAGVKALTALGAQAPEPHTESASGNPSTEPTVTCALATEALTDQANASIQLHPGKRPRNRLPFLALGLFLLTLSAAGLWWHQSGSTLNAEWLSQKHHAPLAASVPPSSGRSTDAPAAQKLIPPIGSENVCIKNLQASSPIVHPHHPAPRKPGNYVHFQAKKTTTVCVESAAGRITKLELKAGQSKSVYDTPPLTVWHSDATIVQMYYQGWKVAGSSSKAGVTIFQP